MNSGNCQVQYQKNRLTSQNTFHAMFGSREDHPFRNSVIAASGLDMQKLMFGKMKLINTNVLC